VTGASHLRTSHNAQYDRNFLYWRIAAGDTAVNCMPTCFSSCIPLVGHPNACICSRSDPGLFDVSAASPLEPLGPAVMTRSESAGRAQTHTHLCAERVHGPASIRRSGHGAFIFVHIK